MNRSIIIILTVIALAGCAHKMAECRGPVFPLNAGQWQPQPSDLLAKE